MNIVKSTGTFGFFTIISRLLGYLRDILIAVFLGTGALADAFFVAFRIPNTFRRLFAEGTFNAAFVPSYTSEIVKGKKQSNKFANDIFNLLFLGLFFLVLFVQIFMPVFVSIIAPGFIEDVEKMNLAINLTRITFPFLFFISLASFFSAILNSHNKFAVASAAPIILNIILIGILFFNTSYGQKKDNLPYELGKIQLPLSESVITNYVFDADSNLYVYSKNIGGYPINTPLVLTVQEFNNLVIEEKINGYFKEKLSLLRGNSENLNEIQKNLLPELYVNSNFFQSIFGSSFIDIKPQGSIGIDLGARFQKNDNPTFSPRNRKNFAFDFDQRITLSLLGKIGERLQITANYDTESTFDFQNLIKLEFNPPKYKLAEDYFPNDLNSTISKAMGKIDYLKSKSDQIKGYEDKISNFMSLPISEDAIIQNIDIGNINMPLNSSLISGAQSLMGVKTQLKFGKTNITAVFAEQRSQSQSLIAQAGGKLQEFSVFALDYESNRHYFLAHYFRDNYDLFLKNYPYINSPINITRVEVWVTNRQSLTNNIRNIVGLQDLGESQIENTRLGNLNENFFNNEGLQNIPRNEINKLDPKSIESGSFLSDDIRDISKTSNAFGPLNSIIKEGIDFVTLESARKLEQNEYKVHNQLGYISLNQRLTNDEILGNIFSKFCIGK